MLEIRNVTKTFNKTLAVDSLSFEVPQGSVFGLLGPNGAGKTTTIRMIMNIIQPDSGHIFYNGESIQRSRYKRVGYLPEERGLYQKMKLKETIVYLARLKGLSPSDASKRTDHFLDRFELTDYSQRKIEELSKGNQQKVQFIIAVIHDPVLVILDEPFSGLDPVNQLLLKDIITELKQNETTVIFSTHQMEQVERMCNEICLISQGKRILYGDLAQIKKDFGTQSVSLEFTGDAKELEDVGLDDLAIANGRLTGILRNDDSLNDFLRNVMERVTVTGFRVEEPTLEQIFIKRVKEV
ncbi:MAG: ATP-binding cassette domain-containing protein [Candidatus Neomarinimicrobiota bacterium]